MIARNGSTQLCMIASEAYRALAVYRRHQSVNFGSKQG